MLINIPLIEWIGYTGSLIVAVSLTMSSIVRLRWLNLTGAVVFSFYGFAIGSLPVALLNLFIVFVNIFYLHSIYSRKEAFKLLSIRGDDAYLKYFLDYYHSEIKKFFPVFDENKIKALDQREDPVSLIILRNAAVAGIFLGNQKKDELIVDLDFVIPEYRDMKPGNFLFNKNQDFFRNKGIKRIISRVKNEKHLNYLKRMGFIEQANAFPEKQYIKIIDK